MVKIKNLVKTPTCTYIFCMRVGGNPGEVAHLHEPNHFQEERPDGHSDSVFFSHHRQVMPIKYLLMIIIIKCVTERHLLNWLLEKGVYE